MAAWPKFITAFSLIACLIAWLIYAGARGNMQSMVTVRELVADGKERERVRLGGRVTQSEIAFRTEPDLLVTFSVTDPMANTNIKETRSIPVFYHGIMPNTLKSGRDVILEGRFNGTAFEATTLLTQCPSKYEPATRTETAPLK